MTRGSDSEESADLQVAGRVEPILREVYGDRAVELADRIQQVVCGRGEPLSPRKPLDAHDTVLITYGDSLLDGDAPPLQVLAEFAAQHLQGVFSTIHLLPFYPYSSDDGFAVIHYDRVNPALGDWPDIHALAEKFDLMFDLVINHVSRECLWFTDYLSQTGPGRDFFLEVDPAEDLSAVVRPRSSPLLTPVETRRGTRYLWATFSEDQIDLDFSNPDVLVMFVGILVDYLRHGARIVRLDAIAFLWKEIGTRCIHLPQTHAIVRVLRCIADLVAPGGCLLTETNVPSAENLSYFGAGDEAHMVYQFPLPPLLLETMLSEDPQHLRTWLQELPAPPAGCTYLNFTASHDGIGVRALEGILDAPGLEKLLQAMHGFGGFVSMRADHAGIDRPYEINIAWFDAMSGTYAGADEWQCERFLCSQLIMLGLQGVPAVYILNLLATGNDMEGVERTGRLRSINRRRWQRADLDPLLRSERTPNHFVFNELRRVLRIRCGERCFDPAVAQHVLDCAPGCLAFARIDADGGRSLIAVHNVTRSVCRPDLAAAGTQHAGTWHDLISGHSYPHGVTDLQLDPYQSAWLVAG